jgi:hypothetical protein
LLFYYIPALGALVSGLNIPLQALLDLLKSLATLGALDIVRLIIFFLLSALAGLWLVYHNTIILAANQVWTCDPVYSARHIVLELLDVLRFIAGGVQAIFNTVAGFMWSLPGVAIRVLLDCTLAEGKCFSVFVSRRARASCPRAVFGRSCAGGELAVHRIGQLLCGKEWATAYCGD